MKRLVSELTGHELDAMVLVASGQPVFEIRGGRCFRHPADGQPELFAPSTDWAHGGPLLERALIWTRNEPDAQDEYRWLAEIIHDDRDGAFEVYGPTLLIAAMRVYVTSRLGKEIELP